MTERCGARTRDGGRCRSHRMRGGRRCRMHGGSSPQARRSAQARLTFLVDPALCALERAVRSHDYPASLVAARDILTRAGVSAGVYGEDEVHRLLRAYTQVVMAHVLDPHTRLAIAADLRRLTGDLGGEDDDDGGGGGNGLVVVNNHPVGEVLEGRR